MIKVVGKWGGSNLWNQVKLDLIYENCLFYNFMANTFYFTFPDPLTNDEVKEKLSFHGKYLFD